MRAHLRLYLIVLQTDTESDKGHLEWMDGLSALSSEVHEENIQYCNDLKPTNNHVGGKHQF